MVEQGLSQWEEALHMQSILSLAEALPSHEYKSGPGDVVY